MHICSTEWSVFAEALDRASRAGSEVPVVSRPRSEHLDGDLLQIISKGVGTDYRRFADLMPWMAGFEGLVTGKSIEKVANAITCMPSVRFLSARVVERYLDWTEPAADLDRESRIASASRRMAQLARVEAKLDSIRNSDAQASGAALIEDREAMVFVWTAVALEGSVDKLDLPPGYEDALEQSASAGYQSLALLQGLLSQKDEPIRSLAHRTGLDDRSIQFETNLAFQLEKHGFESAVRAVLAVTGVANGRDEATQLARLGWVLDSSAHLALARALARVRGKCLGYLRGEVPLDALASWVEYLRGAVSHLTDEEPINRGEAVSFAHYSLHLLNICDLAGAGAEAVSERARTALFDLENWLKDFATVSGTMTAHGVSRSAPKLQHSADHSPGGCEQYLTYRIARLASRKLDAYHTQQLSGLAASAEASERGEIPGLIRAEWRRLESRGVIDLERARRILENMYIEGAEMLAKLSPVQCARLVGLALAGIDAELFEKQNSTNGTWTLDLTRLEDWCGPKGEGSPQLFELIAGWQLVEGAESACFAPADNGLFTEIEREQQKVNVVFELAMTEQTFRLATVAAKNCPAALEDQIWDHLRNVFGAPSQNTVERGDQKLEAPLVS